MMGKKKEKERQEKKWGKEQIPLSNSFLTPALPQISIFKKLENAHKMKEKKKKMEKGYPKVVWLFVFVCVQKRRTRGAGARKPRPFPDDRPDWPPAAPPASTRAAPEASVRGAPEGRGLLDLAAAPTALPFLPVRSPFPSRFSPKARLRRTTL